MEFAVRQPQAVSSATRKADGHHRCPQCRQEALVLNRRHVSPVRLGPSLTTEYYDCASCDARYQYTPATNRWRPVSQ